LTARACEIRLRAEWKAGQLLQTIERADKGRPAKMSGRRGIKADPFRDGLRLVTFPPRYRSALEPSGELTPTWLARIGEAAMTGVLNDLLLFSCLAAFVTGVVIAAATILI
jgi:hypothetical protein